MNRANSTSTIQTFDFIPGCLQFWCVPHGTLVPESSSSFHIFSTDDTLKYTAFFADFGPLNLGNTYKFCIELDSLLKKYHQSKCVAYVCSSHPHHRANSAVLILAYMIFVRNFSAEEAYKPFIGVEPPFTTFRDAAFCINTYPLTVIDCARAFAKVILCGHFNINTFSLQQYESLQRLENGDITWIVPGKFIAFSGPVAEKREISPGVFVLSPEGYVPVFRSLGVTCVIRFNKKCYDRNIFVRAGIHHVDLFYEDGGNPTDSILQSFLRVCETEAGAIAVHCKAGLGRTGTNIVAYMMKHYKYTAREATAWCRICRPGCVVGPQQQYCESIQYRMWFEGFASENASKSNAHSSSLKSNSNAVISKHSNISKSLSESNDSYERNGTQCVSSIALAQLFETIKNYIPRANAAPPTESPAESHLSRPPLPSQRPPRATQAITNNQAQMVATMTSANSKFVKTNSFRFRDMDSNGNQDQALTLSQRPATSDGSLSRPSLTNDSQGPSNSRAKNSAEDRLVKEKSAKTPISMNQVRSAYMSEMNSGSSPAPDDRRGSRGGAMEASSSSNRPKTSSTPSRLPVSSGLASSLNASSSDNSKKMKNSQQVSSRKSSDSASVVHGAYFSSAIAKNSSSLRSKLR